MQLKLEEIIIKKEYPNSVIESANFQGDHTALLKERILISENLEKLADLYYNHIKTCRESDISEIVYTLPFSYNETASYLNAQIKELNENAPLIEADGKMDQESTLAMCRNIKFGSFEERGKVIDSIKGTIENIFSKTGVNIFGRTANFGGWCGSIETTAFKNDLERNIAESHEKGHGIRYFVGESDVTKKIQNGFDLTKFTPDERVSLELKVEMSKEQLLQYYATTMELIERMAQLKSYFGITTEGFSLKHLQYARENYEKDYGQKYGIDMNCFFSMITPEKEETFINLMNELPL